MFLTQIKKKTNKKQNKCDDLQMFYLFLFYLLHNSPLVGT